MYVWIKSVDDIEIDTESEESKRSTSVIEGKVFDMTTLSLRPSERRMTQRIPSRSAEGAEIPYTKAIDLIPANPRFMTKEELVTLKLCPIRNWRLPRRSSTIVGQPKQKCSCKCKVIAAVSIAVLVVGAAILIYFFIK